MFYVRKNSSVNVTMLPFGIGKPQKKVLFRLCFFNDLTPPSLVLMAWPLKRPTFFPASLNPHDFRFEKLTKGMEARKIMALTEYPDPK